METKIQQIKEVIAEFGSIHSADVFRMVIGHTIPDRKIISSIELTGITYGEEIDGIEMIAGHTKFEFLGIAVIDLLHGLVMEYKNKQKLN